MSSEETSADRNVEIWKIKKLIKSLEMARGWVGTINSNVMKWIKLKFLKYAYCCHIAFIFAMELCVWFMQQLPDEVQLRNYTMLPKWFCISLHGRNMKLPFWEHKGESMAGRQQERSLKVLKFSFFLSVQFVIFSLR